VSTIDLPLSTVIKGLGSLKDENHKVKAFLQECLEDKRIDPDTKKIIELILNSDSQIASRY